MYCILKGFKSYRNCVVHCYLYNWGFYKEDAPTIKNQFKYVLELFEILGNSKVVIRLENILPNTEYKEAIIKIFRKLHKENINIPVKINFCTNYISKAHYKKLKIDFVNSLKNSKWVPNIAVCRQSDIKEYGESCIDLDCCNTLKSDILRKGYCRFNNNNCKCLGNKKYIKTLSKTMDSTFSYNIYKKGL